MNKKGWFITLEGVEGAGKSTQLPAIRDFFTARGYGTLCLREPGGTPVAEEIRGLLKRQTDGDELCDLTELLLLYAARAQLVSRRIQPALEQGKVVICDRFDLSTAAYQGGGRGIAAETIETLRQLTLGCFAPDLTLIFDVPPEVGMERIRSRGEPDRFERCDLDFFRRVRAAYLQAAERCPGSIRVIDAGGTPDEVSAAVHSQLQALMDRSQAQNQDPGQNQNQEQSRG